MNIPKKIHHIWLQGGIPDKYKSNYNKWELNGWEHKVWDFKSIFKFCTEDQKQIYIKLTTLINRVNYLKYILMYHQGGIFVDLDTYPVKNLDLFFKEIIIKNIDLSSLLSIRYPFTTPRPHIPFKNYDIILTGRNTMFFYPNGDKPVLIDNPVLMGSAKNLFWLNLLDWCKNRTNLKAGGISNTKYLPHEPYGPFGLTDFVFSNFKKPYLEKILILPPSYLINDTKHINDKTYIIHNADKGW